MSKKNTLGLICNSHRSAEKAVCLLQAANFNVGKISIIGKDYFIFGEDACISSRDGRKRMLDGMAFWFRMWHLLPGDAFFRMPGVGSIIVAGPLSKPIRMANTSPFFFKTRPPLQDAMRTIGISRESFARYEAALRSGCFLVIVQGDQDETSAAGSILKSCVNLNATNGKLADSGEWTMLGHSESGKAQEAKVKHPSKIALWRTKIPGSTGNQYKARMEE